ncbi:MAG: asparagine synthetase B, partial [Candidatus Bathyarchaeota archaeon]|nr:asparagine synthetase B [Candidatus Bathyarchaeota archaeon]
MGAITAIVSKKNENVAKKAVTMLKMVEHKDAETFGLASPTTVIIGKSIGDLQDKDPSSPVLIGHVFSKILMSDAPQPIKFHEGTFVFEGRIYSLNTEFSSAEFVTEKLNQNLRNAKALIKDFEGGFAFAVAESGRLMAGRDSLGLYPLYYGENTDLAALASERKALWKIGIKEVHSFPPGHIAVVDKHGFRFKPAKTLAHARTKQITMQTAAKKLSSLLQQSVKQKVSGLKEVAVAFSGGLDSTIIASLAKKFGVEVHLISVSLKNQPEIEQAKKAAEALNLSLHICLYSEKTVEKVLPKVLWLIEETNPVKTSIGIPVFWTAEETSKMGFKIMCAGQGADELFGGYKRYLNDYMRYGTESVRKTIFNDIAGMYENNFERDNKICNFHNVELRLPFATHQLAK